MSSPAPHRFKQPVWELGDLIGWVLDRDPAQFGRTFTAEDCRSALVIARFYKGQSAVDRNADRTILHALQAGKLVARDRDGRPIGRDAWMPRSEIYLRQACREYLVYGEDCLRLWPEQSVDPGDDCSRRRDTMVDDDERFARKHRRREWRRRWIAKLAERQRAARRWIAVVDLVDWCAHSTTTATLDAEMQAKEVAYRRLTDSILKGEFERYGRSKILYLDTLVTSDGTSPRCRLTREQFEIALGATAAPTTPSLPITVLNCCWLPADLARQWLEAHGYRLPPYLEHPQAAGEGVENRDASKWSPTLDLRSAIRKAISALGRPPGNPRWEVFCDRVRLEGKASGMRPYTDRHIKRAFKAIAADPTEDD